MYSLVIQPCIPHGLICRSDMQCWHIILVNRSDLKEPHRKQRFIWWICWRKVSTCWWILSSQRVMCIYIGGGTIFIYIYDVHLTLFAVYLHFLYTLLHTHRSREQTFFADFTSHHLSLASHHCNRRFGPTLRRPRRVTMPRHLPCLKAPSIRLSWLCWFDKASGIASKWQ